MYNMCLICKPKNRSGDAHNAGQHGTAQEGAQNQLVPRVDPRASKASLVFWDSIVVMKFAWN